MASYASRCKWNMELGKYIEFCGLLQHVMRYNMIKSDVKRRCLFSIWDCELVTCTERFEGRCVARTASS